jgi:endonuclease-8
LGPDVLAAEFDAAEARRRLRETPARHIAEALLRQQSMAGLGNVYKSELLFLCAVHPMTAVDDVTEDELECLLRRARQLMRLNVSVASMATAPRARITTGRLNPREPLWVYDRAGAPCFKCGTPIESVSETEGRRTYWCPACQPVRARGTDPTARPANNNECMN